MAIYLLDKERWKKQPTGEVEPDWSHPFFQSSYAWVISKKTFWDTTGRVVIVPSIIKGVSQSGERWGNLTAVTVASVLSADSSPNCSMLGVGMYSSYDMAPSTASQNYYGTTIFSTQAQMGGGSSGPGGRRSLSWDAVPGAYAYACTFRGFTTQTNWSAYVDGRSATGKTASGTASAYLYGSGVSYRRGYLPNVGTNGETSSEMVAKTSRQLEDTFLKELTENPWQILKPRRKILYFGTSGTSYTRIATLGALAQKLETKQTGIQAQLQKQALLNTAQLQAQLAKAITGSTQLSSQLQAAVSRAASVDAALLKQVLAIAGVDAALSANILKSASVGAVLQKQTALSSLCNAVLQANKTGSVNLDSILVAMGGGLLTSQLGALLQSSESLSASLDAALSKQGVKSTDINAVLSKIIALNSSVDARLQKQRSSNTALAAQLAKQVTGVVSLDATLITISAGLLTAQLGASLQKSGLLASTGINAALMRSGSQTASIEASLSKLVSAGTMLGAEVQKQGILQATSLSAALQVSEALSVGLDGALAIHVDKTTSLAAILSKLYVESVGLDAIIIDVLLRVRSYIDASLQKSSSKTIAMSAILTKVFADVGALIDISIYGMDTSISINGIDNDIWIH